MSITLPTTDLVLEHYSRKPVEGLVPYPHTQNTTDKPNGFWVSIKGDYDWPWFVQNELNEDRLQHKIELELKPDTRLLLLDTVDAVLEFTEQYGIVPEWAGSFSQSIYHIDWASVAEVHDGVVIAPYHWPLRLEPKTMWYYGWDVASGCIWNIDQLTIRKENDE